MKTIKKVKNQTKHTGNSEGGNITSSLDLPLLSPSAKGNPIYNQFCIFWWGGLKVQVQIQANGNRLPFHILNIYLGFHTVNFSLLIFFNESKNLLFILLFYAQTSLLPQRKFPSFFWGNFPPTSFVEIEQQICGNCQVRIREI